MIGNNLTGSRKRSWHYCVAVVMVVVWWP